MTDFTGLNFDGEESVAGVKDSQAFTVDCSDDRSRVACGVNAGFPNCFPGHFIERYNTRAIRATDVQKQQILFDNGRSTCPKESFGYLVLFVYRALPD